MAYPAHVAKDSIYENKRAIIATHQYIAETIKWPCSRTAIIAGADSLPAKESVLLLRSVPPADASTQPSHRGHPC